MKRSTARVIAGICNIAFLCGALTAAHHAQAEPVTQSTGPAGSSSSPGSDAWQQLGSIALASNTNIISGLTSTVTLVDQGWGGQAGTNGVRIDLFSNGTDLWGQYVAGATHDVTTQTFDIAALPDAQTSLNVALDSINWSVNPTVALVMDATPWPYVGWALYTSGASFGVMSDAIPAPEPLSVAILGTGLIGLGLIRKHKNS